MDLFEAIHSQRAIRAFRPDPVPDELVSQVLEAAIRAPSGGNLQPWAFLVVRDPAQRGEIAAIYRRASERYSGGAPVTGGLAASLSDVPVLILACIRHSASRGSLVHGAHIYPAVQNLMLAARGLGLGTVITTLHRMFEREVKALLGVPDDVDTAALIPLGYPAEGTRFGPTTRNPLEDVAHLDRWGTPWR